MSGSGALIGMEATIVQRRGTPKVLRVGLTAWFVAVAGAVMSGTAVCRTVTAAVPTTVAAVLASVSPSPSNNLFVEF